MQCFAQAILPALVITSMASSSSAGPPTKHRRLEQLRGSTPYVSQSAISAICQNIKENGLPSETSRHQFNRATKAILDMAPSRQFWISKHLMALRDLTQHSMSRATCALCGMNQNASSNFLTEQLWLPLLNLIALGVSSFTWMR